MTINRKPDLLRAIVLVIAIILYGIPVPAKEMAGQIKRNLGTAKKKTHVVFLVTEDSLNYEAHKTIPVFAEMLQKDYGYKTTVLLGSGGHGSYTYPNIEVVSKADLLVIFARRIALPSEQLNVIKSYVSTGKPIIGIRTANHAFKVNGNIAAGFEEWPAFVADILGCENRGYGSAEQGADVSVIREAAGHSILKNLSGNQWHCEGSLYLVAPLLDKDATVLLRGKVNDKTEPVAWTRTAGKSKVFYTSLGYPSDFKTANFIILLTNGIQWALDKGMQE